MNIMRANLVFCIFLVLLPTALLYAQRVVDDTAQSVALEAFETAHWTLKDRTRSIERACTVVGVPASHMDSLDSVLVILNDDQTPYLNARLIGRPLWHVVIPNWRIALKSTGAAGRDQHTRTFDIHLDPVDGRVLKIKSRWPTGAVPVLTDLDALSAAQQMRRSGNEIYHGFPTESLKINFVDALDSIRQTGINPLDARQIIGRYVLHSRMGREPKAVWAITLRGVLPRPRHRRKNSKRYAQHRYIIDAATGEWITATNTPDPKILWTKDEKSGVDSE